MFSPAAGALHGVHKRVVVVCRIMALSFELAALAILTDTSSLALPDGVHGIVGLKFLRQFQSWGAEKTTDGSWRFFVAVG